MIYERSSANSDVSLRARKEGNVVKNLFIEPKPEALDSIRGNIHLARAGYHDDADPSVCDHCQCNCDDDYGRMAKKVLMSKN